MKKDILRLAQIAKKQSRSIIGLMSGTSLDGLDVALCRIAGSGLKTKLSLEKFITIPYSPAVKARIREVFAKSQVNFVSLSNSSSLDRDTTWRNGPQLSEEVAH